MHERWHGHSVVHVLRVTYRFGSHVQLLHITIVVSFNVLHGTSAEDRSFE